MMNTVNRVVMVILLLVAMVLCTVSLLVPVPVFDAVTQQSAALVEYLKSLTWYARLFWGIIFALTLDVIFGLFFFLEVRRPKSKAIRAEKAAGGEVQVSVASIADRLRYEIDQLPGVLRVKSKVSAKRGGVVIELDVETVAEINVPEKAGQIVEKARQVMEEKMGLKLARPPKVNLHAVPHTGAPSSPPPPESHTESAVVEEPVDEVMAEYIEE